MGRSREGEARIRPHLSGSVSACGHRSAARYTWKWQRSSDGVLVVVERRCRGGEGRI